MGNKREAGSNLRNVHAAEDALLDSGSSPMKRAAARFSLEAGGLDLLLVESDLQKLLGERAGTIFPSNQRVHELYNEELLAAQKSTNRVSSSSSPSTSGPSMPAERYRTLEERRTNGELVYLQEEFLQSAKEKGLLLIDHGYRCV